LPQATNTIQGPLSDVTGVRRVEVGRIDLCDIGPRVEEFGIGGAQ